MNHLEHSLCFNSLTTPKVLRRHRACLIRSGRSTRRKLLDPSANLVYPYLEETSTAIPNRKRTPNLRASLRAVGCHVPARFPASGVRNCDTYIPFRVSLHLSCNQRDAHVTHTRPAHRLIAPVIRARRRLTRMEIPRRWLSSCILNFVHVQPR